jgi:hypothetical protein
MTKKEDNISHSLPKVKLPNNMQNAIQSEKQLFKEFNISYFETNDIANLLIEEIDLSLANTDNIEPIREFLRQINRLLQDGSSKENAQLVLSSTINDVINKLFD